MNDCIRNILNKANDLQCNSVAIPPISTGIFNFPIDLCAKTIMESIEDFAQKAPRQLKDRFFLKEVRIVIIDFPTFDKFRKEFMRRY